MLKCMAPTRLTLPVWQLQYVPVDTIICFRASCPIVIAIIEFLYLGRELPSLRSWASLLGENSLHPEAPTRLTSSSEPSAMPSLISQKGGVSSATKAAVCRHQQAHIPIGTLLCRCLCWSHCVHMARRQLHSHRICLDHHLVHLCSLRDGVCEEGGRHCENDHMVPHILPGENPCGCGLASRLLPIVQRLRASPT